MPKKRSTIHLNGGGRVPHFAYGVLRAVYAGQANSTVDAAAEKLLVANPDSDWIPRASRAEVLLPAGAPDTLTSPRQLWGAYEAARLDRQRDLAVMLTIFGPEWPTLHQGYELVRAWAMASLVRQRRLAVMLALHVPSLVGSPHDAHVHVMASAREHRPWGFASFSDLCSDTALLALYAEWAAFQAAH